ncbi:MAG: alpha/beta hydrolase [Pseudomonadota bacterium]
MPKIILLVVCLVLTGCQSTGLHLANMANDENRYSVKEDIAYGEQPWQKLNIYQPAEKSDVLPTIVFYYGGSWRSGSKDDYAFVANRFTREGYVVIIPDYAKYPESIYPSFVEDAALVSYWINENAEDYLIDKTSLYLMGHSAGAHTGIMLIADDSYLSEYDLMPSLYSGFVGIAGPYDFVPSSKRYSKIFGGEENFPLMQATNYLDGSEPPMLLLTAGLDWLVADSNTEKVVSFVNNAGGEIHTINYPALGHLTIIGSLSESVPFGGDVSEDILKFIENIETKQELSYLIIDR